MIIQIISNLNFSSYFAFLRLIHFLTTFSSRYILNASKNDFHDLINICIFPFFYLKQYENM